MSLWEERVFAGRKRKKITIHDFLLRMYKRRKHDGILILVPVVSAGVRAHWCLIVSTYCMIGQCSYGASCTISILDVCC